MDCLFCKIIKGEINSEIIYRDELVIAFNDIRPQAPTHKLIVPHEHIATINDLTINHAALTGHMILVAGELARRLNLADEGYRLVFNCKAQGGQEIYHIHLHLLGGRQMTWPPG